MSFVHAMLCGREERSVQAALEIVRELTGRDAAGLVRQERFLGQLLRGAAALPRPCRRRAARALARLLVPPGTGHVTAWLAGALAARVREGLASLDAEEERGALTLAVEAIRVLADATWAAQYPGAGARKPPRSCCRT